MNELTRTFAFETDFKQTLRCVPMAVRIKLDLAGIKLSLKEWALLATEDKHELLAFSWQGADPAGAFGRRVEAMVLARTGRAPARCPVPEVAPWQGAAVPPAVIDRAAVDGVQVADDRWGALSPLQRFALVKLSRPGHENANFLVAAREFGAV